MRVRLDALRLLGTSRSIVLAPGLNLVTGPIASGKSTLFRLVRAMFGASLDDLPVEVRANVVALAGRVNLRGRAFDVVRPVTTSPRALVSIAGEDTAMQLPYSQSAQQGGVTTYTNWLLDELGLPRLRVRAAPTRLDSELVPLSINDYFLYTRLSQQELGWSLFGSDDYFTNVKRQYVFRVAYGLLNVRAAGLQEQLAAVVGEMRVLRNREESFTELIAGTPFENRAAVSRELAEAQAHVSVLEEEAILAARTSAPNTQAESLRTEIQAMEKEQSRLRSDRDREREAVDDLIQLARQLEAQIGRIARALVAEKHLSDVAFVVCPNCGRDVHPSADPTACYLCKQEVVAKAAPQALVDEQEQLGEQVIETRQLAKARRRLAEELDERARAYDTKLNAAHAELNFLTASFVSSEATHLAAAAAARANALADVRRLSEYLSIYDSRDSVSRRLAELEEREAELSGQLDVAEQVSAEAEARIRRLEDIFNQILDRFRPPEFGEVTRSSIDRRTFLPVFRGRRFDEISSPGLATLVSVAYALANQRAAVELALPLPGILMLDGLSEHLGHEGLDPERLNAVYEELARTSDELGDSVQLIVVDNVVPEGFRPYVRLEFGEGERLIPVER